MIQTENMIRAIFGAVRVFRRIWRSALRLCAGVEQPSLVDSILKFEILKFDLLNNRLKDRIKALTFFTSLKCTGLPQLHPEASVFFSCWLLITSPTAKTTDQRKKQDNLQTTELWKIRHFTNTLDGQRCEISWELRRAVLTKTSFQWNSPICEAIRCWPNSWITYWGSVLSDKFSSLQRVLNHRWVDVDNWTRNVWNRSI